MPAASFANLEKYILNKWSNVSVTVYVPGAVVSGIISYHHTSRFTLSLAKLVQEILGQTL